MCVGFWTLSERDPTYSLILCANRDEFLARPALPAHFHSFGSSSTTEDGNDRRDVLSGVDAQAGGTWTGVNREGRVTFITNITEPYKISSVSRGAFVSSFLQPSSSSSSTSSFQDYIDHTITPPGTTPPDTGGFNLLVFSPTTSSSSSSSELSGIRYEAALVTNSGAGGPVTSRSITGEEADCGGISNGIDGREIDGIGSKAPWTKVSQGRARLEEILTSRVSTNNDGDNDNDEASEMELVESLMNLLGTQTPPGSVSIASREALRYTILVPPVHFAPKQIGDTPPQPKNPEEAMTSLPVPEPNPSSPTANKPAPQTQVQTPSTMGPYGTRVSTVILVRRSDGRVLFVERDRAVLKSSIGEPEEIVQGNKADDRVFRFTIESSQG